MKKVLLPLFLLPVGLVFSSCNSADDPPPANAQMVNGWTITGATAQPLTGTEAGLAPETYPQIKFVSSEEYRTMKDNNTLPETGLFLVDTDYVPSNIDELLANQSATLQSDGRLLDAEGHPVALFMSVETLQITPILSDPSNELANAAPGIERRLKADYTWRGAWATTRSDYHYYSGTCRRYKASIQATARVLVDGTYYNAAVEYMETHVTIDGGTSSHSCTNCATDSSSRDKRCDCVIPIAHSHSGEQFFYMRSGLISASKTYYL